MSVFRLAGDNLQSLLTLNGALDQFLYSRPFLECAVVVLRLALELILLGMSVQLVALLSPTSEQRQLVEDLELGYTQEEEPGVFRATAHIHCLSLAQACLRNTIILMAAFKFPSSILAETALASRTAASSFLALWWTIS